MSISRYRWVLKLCLVGVLVMSGHISEAMATDYFVAASNGNDGNRGTLQEPFLTLERGISVLIPGDTLFVRGGTYVGSHNLSKIPNGYSWAQPVSIKAYGKEKVVITAMRYVSALYFLDGSHHVIIEGFVFDAKGGANGIQTGNKSHHIRIINSEIMNADANGILTGLSDDLEFIGLKIHDNGVPPHKGYGIYLAGNHVLVENCFIYDNGGYGIHMYSDFNKPSYNKIANNKIYNNSQIVQVPGVGIFQGTENSVINNIIWGNYLGVEVNYGASNTKIFNNTIHANTFYGIWVGPSSQNALVKNNIASLNGGNGIIITKGSGSTQIFNNLVAATNSSTGLKNWEDKATLKGNIAGSINDIKYANHQNHDFHLQAGSLAIGAGVVLSEVKNDYDYASRNQATAYDIGAFSFNGTPAPPPANSTPPPSSSDTTAPTVTLTAPSAGTVSGTVTVSASASDNVGVAGVQFRLQGSNLGPEDTTNAYSTSWNTTTVSNGSYSLTATARDAAGNTTTSSPRTVTVSNAITSPSTTSLSITNLTVASGQAYVVPASGLQAGSTVYRDRTYTFTTVPSVVQGARYIQTANNDKAGTSATFLRFTVNQPVSVYVAHGDRISPKPSWLNAFTDTGMNLVTSDTTLSLFVRTFPAGTITLGGNVSSANAGNSLSMYSVIVKPQSGTGTTTPPPSSPPTTSLSITNLTVASGQTYVVPASGLQAGGTVYRDRTYTFTTVPSIVQGARYIQTANNDKAGTSATFLRFTVNQPVSVYVAHGDRISPKPSWLNAFTDTGMNLVTSDTTLSLFVRTFPAGTITLGGNVSSGTSGNLLSMYSVIIKQ